MSDYNPTPDEQTINQISEYRSIVADLAEFENMDKLPIQLRMFLARIKKAMDGYDDFTCVFHLSILSTVGNAVSAIHQLRHIKSLIPYSAMQINPMINAHEAYLLERADLFYQTLSVLPHIDYKNEYLDEQISLIKKEMDDLMLRVNARKPVFSPVKGSGYVYFIKDIEITGRVKIGKAKDVGSRARVLGILMPFETELLHVIKCSNYSQAESHFHRIFADKRSTGEWFNLTDEDIDQVKKIAVM